MKRSVGYRMVPPAGQSAYEYTRSLSEDQLRVACERRLGCVVRHRLPHGLPRFSVPFELVEHPGKRVVGIDVAPEGKLVLREFEGAIEMASFVGQDQRESAV